MTRSRDAPAAATIAVVLLSSLGGCGGEADAPSNGLTHDEQTAADNLAAQIVRSAAVSGNSGEDMVSRTEASCIAEGAVHDVGLPALQGYGIVTDDLLVNKGIQGVEMSEEDADALAGVFVDCVDAEELFEKQLLSGVPSPSAQTRDCVRTSIDSAMVREVLSTSFQGRTSSAYDRLREDVAQCGSEAR